MKIDTAFFTYVIRVGKSNGLNTFYDIILEDIGTVPSTKGASLIQKPISSNKRVPQTIQNSNGNNLQKNGGTKNSLAVEVIDDPEGFIKKVNGDRNVLSGVRDLLRKIKNNLAISLTKSEKAKLDKGVTAQENIVSILQFQRLNNSKRH